MKILISGASGLVGTHLIPTLEAKNHKIYKLVRKTPRSSDEIQWDAARGFSKTEQAKIENFDAVVHLAGDNVASENWSDEKKRKIKESRTIGTKVLVDALQKTQNPPKHFISASAVGFYGNRQSEICTEESVQGAGFLPEVCAEWEREAMRAESFARVVCMRIGVVLAKDGGALEKMLTPFKFGVGGTVGSGKQWMSWIALDDIVSIIDFFLDNENLRGAFNLTAPNPVTNEEFTKALGHALNRPTILPIPEFAIKLMFGEMGETLLLQGARAVPKRLEEAGYKFKYTNVDEAMKHVVN
ncbi:MAG TPA: TIGR01777 family oxidoreductase [Pyrinomonadaceae bacterium]|nr:TIGR01777 family oxidoreductase [Pyrinomonadaceae bacterium]